MFRTKYATLHANRFDMKKILTLFVILATGVSSFAQTIWKDTVLYNGFPKDGGVYGLYDTIYNNSSSPLTLTWSKSSETLLSGWTGIGVCDGATGATGTCYGWTDLSSMKSITIAGNGKATLEVQMKAATTAADGCSYVTLGTNFGNVTFKFCAWATQTKDFDNSNLVTIYPNPATDYVNIALNDKRISSINVVSVIGRRIARFAVEPTRNDAFRVPLDKVADGIYLLQFADANGKVLGVRRVTKQ